MDERNDVVVHVAVAGGPAEADLVGARLWAEGAVAVEVVDEDGGVLLKAGYPTPDAARDVAARLGPSLGAVAVEVTDRTWRDAWREWAEPVAVGRGLLVVPAWRPVTVGPGRLSLEIDPGPCFGSGSHPSTRLLLAWLDAHPPGGLDVVDVGTGSGILAVAAARLGARRVLALDIDPDAVEVTRANAERNGVGALVEARTTEVQELPASSADVVLVNVTAGVHASIGRSCARSARPGADVVIAGLLPGQWRHVADAYRDLSAPEPLSLDGWEGARLRRPA